MHKVHNLADGYVFKEQVEAKSFKRQSTLTSFPDSYKSAEEGKTRGMMTRRSTKWSLLARDVQSSPNYSNRPLARGSTMMGIGGRLMDKSSLSSRMLDREIMKMTRVQEEQERREEKEKEKQKYVRHAQSAVLRQIGIFGSYRKSSLMSRTSVPPPIPEPLEKFRRVVRLLSFLQRMKCSTDRKRGQKQQQSMVATVLEQLEDEAQAGLKAHEGMLFDPNHFKAVREVQLNQEAVHILSLNPYTRTDEDLQTALTALKASVSAFGEYPLKMQKRLVSVGWYERFEAKRVIIRQGHRAENFYFILSGTAIVTLLVIDNSGEQRNNMIAVLTKGSSFGELALLHHKTRSATVLCKDEVSLLAVGREDFRNIFMSYEDGKEPEHIRFLKTVPYLRDLPLDDLVTKHDRCIFHYFRRGVVIVKGGKTDWIYIVKTGSCRVLTHLVKRTATGKRRCVRSPREQSCLPAISVHERDRRRALLTVAGHRERPIVVSPLLKRSKTEPEIAKGKKADLSLPAIIGGPEKFKKTVKNVAIPWLAQLSTTEAKITEAEEHRRKIEALHKRVSGMDASKCPTKQNDTEHMSEDDPRNERVVVQIELLKPKDQFGMSSVVLDKPGVQCHLVSNGAECVLINKSWLLQHANESTMRMLRSQIPPYPSQETLEQKMQDQANWDSYKTQTINQLLDTLHL